MSKTERRAIPFLLRFATERKANHLHSQVSTPLSNTLLGSSLQSPLELEVVDTLPDGFTVGSTLWCWLLSVTPSDSDSVDEVTLLGLVA